MKIFSFFSFFSSPSVLFLPLLLCPPQRFVTGGTSRSVLTKIRQASATIPAHNVRFFQNNKQVFPSTRLLQGGDACAPTEAFEDDDAVRRFSVDFEPSCTCKSIESDIGTYLAENPVPKNNDTAISQTWLDDLNTAASKLVEDEQDFCRNKCSVCVSADSPCLLLDTEQRSYSRFGLIQNFTIEDLATVENAEVASIVESRLRVFSSSLADRHCYMAAGSSSGKVCAEISIDDLSDSLNEGTFFCAVSVDGVACDKCEVDSSVDVFCLTADCTNIAGNSASLDFCSGTRESFVGVFGPLFDLAVVEDVTYTLGSCDGSMTPPTAGMPATPTAAPVENGATGKPVAAAVSPTDRPTRTTGTPVAKSKPTNAPVDMTAPTKAPEEKPTTTNAPEEKPTTTKAPEEKPTTTKAPAAMPAPTKAPVAMSEPGNTTATMPTTTNVTAPTGGLVSTPGASDSALRSANCGMVLVVFLASVFAAIQ